MKISTLALLTFIFLSAQCFAQVGVGTTTSNASSVLDITSNSKGVLFPRLSQSQRNSMNPLTASAQGLIVYQTDAVQGFYYNTSTTTTPTWVLLAPESNPFDFGDYKLSGRTSDHRGWLLCDGRAISRTTYAGLFALLGTSFGVGDGSTTFNLPDFRGRVAGGTGTGPSLTTRNPGAAVGTETHVLTTAQMPSHNHGINDPGHGHTIRGSYDYNNGGSTIAAYAPGTNSAQDRYNSTYSNVTGITINSTGGGSAHNIMQPTLFAGNYFVYGGN